MMGTLDPGDANMIELDDSGCVGDAASPVKTCPEMRRVSLLDLSDHVLLEVLKYCEPRDLKALGFTCPRLGALIQDRTLWTVVEERSHAVSKARLRWYLHNGLNEGTKTLLLTGYARNESQQSRQNGPLDLVVTPAMSTCGTQTEDDISDKEQPSTSSSSPASQPQQTPINKATPSPPPKKTPQPAPPAEPLLTLNEPLLLRLRQQCKRLERLSLEYCNIDCNQTKLSLLPPTLKYLSMRGSKCYNLPLDKSFMFRVNDCLPDLEEVDLSDCSWLEGCVLLPLSKLTKLTKLSARHCRKLGEFIAYASLAARYGFRALKILDFSGSPVRDSEVSAFSWCPCLEEMYLASRCGDEARDERGQCSDLQELHQWETECPEYFNNPKESDEQRPNEKQSFSSSIYARPFVNESDEIPRITNVVTITVNHNRNNNTINISAEHLAQDGGQNQNGGGVGDAQNGGPPNIVHRDNASGAGETGDAPIIGPPNLAQRDRHIFGIDMTTQRNPDNSQNNQDGAGPSGNNQNGVTDQIRDKKRVAEDSSSDEEDVVPKKVAKIEDTENSTSKDKPEENMQKFVRFRRNQPPVVITQRKQENGEDNAQNNDANTPPEQNGNVPLNLAPNQERRNVFVQNAAHFIQDQNAARIQPENPNAHIVNGAAEIYDNPNLQNVQPSNWVLINQNPNLPRDEPAIRVVNEDEPRNENEPDGRYHVLYVNVGRQMHAAYQVSLEQERPVCRQIPPNVDADRWDNYRGQLWNIYRQMQMASMEVDSTTFVSDTALLRFGNQQFANIVQRGPRGEIVVDNRNNGKPKQSKLKVLVCTGYRNVTDSSLIHLATSAPDLRFIDLTGTGVTAEGVEKFKSWKPDCEVKFGGPKQGGSS